MSVQHEDGLFFIEQDGKHVGELTYRMAGNDMVVSHAFVDPSLRGGTLGRDLVAAAVSWARAQNHKVVPACSYVRSVFAATPEYADVRK
jgi:predicted GNAT family acetyltransferase